MYLTIRTLEDVELHWEKVRASAAKTQTWLRAHEGDPMNLLRSMKFEAVGWHPITDHPLNVIEQINQTFTFAVALAATRELLRSHPEAGGFRLAPGAHASLPLDIMSKEAGLVGAETFAAVSPRNNGKLKGDLNKLVSRPEKHRYVFFASPLFPGTRRLPELEKDEIQVWSVDV